MCIDEEERNEAETESQTLLLREKHNEVMNQILQPDLAQRQLTHVDPESCSDRSAPQTAGKVLRFDLAPQVALTSYRDLLRQISNEEKRKKLKKTKTYDRSAPFIPQDIEIFCVGDPPKYPKKTDVRYKFVGSFYRLRLS